jgi:MOSC domain-containing protein YiiM
MEKLTSVADELDIELRPGDVRENLTITGLLEDDLAGGEITIGEATLTVVKERVFCYRMDPLHPSARPVLDSHRAAYMCEVSAGGPIAVGDEVVFARP